MSASSLLRQRFASRKPRLVRIISFLAVMTASSQAAAATWIDNRLTPRLSELVSVDATGEWAWPYGSEDVAGDGLGTFNSPEQSLDIRTVYAATDQTQFWVRLYVSSPAAVATDLTAYVFVDADRNAATGRTAAAAELDPAFTVDPSPGGYEFVIEISGSGSVSDLWEYRAAQNQFVSVNIAPANAAAEIGSDIDPARINGPLHGYLQARINHNVIGIAQVCNANVFVRAVSPNGSDLDAGDFGSCVPSDSNNDGTPDVALPPRGCTLDAECPGAGRCVDGTCRAGVGCTTDAQCPPDEQCASDGRCLARPGGSCTSSAQCGDLVCVNGQCSACRSTPECGDGEVCSATGKCTGGVALAPGEKVEGGAFNCALSSLEVPERPGSTSNNRPYFMALVASIVLLVGRRRSRSS